jgi:phosphatidylserine/phosphatidylglycerophosphate/cardiolipin synthase-like enzyme
MKTFKGIITIKENTIFLDAGGVVVQLEGQIENFQSFNGQFTTITGMQEADVIRQAAIISRPEAANVSTDAAIKLDQVITVIKENQNRLKSIPGVFGVRPGDSSEPDKNFELVIVVLTYPNVVLQDIPAAINGIRLEQRMASVQEITQGLIPLSEWEGIIAEAAAGPPNIHYKPPADIKLEELKVNNITCHVGPDASWKTLKPFLEGTTETLTVAMYEFYAEHIKKAVSKLGEQSDAKLNMILQVSSNDRDIEQMLVDNWGRDRVEFVKASVSGAHRIFNNSYHTKVAVRDSNAFWLSSGNWSPNSQPLIEPGSEQFMYRNGNREWHVIVEDEAMAMMYEKFIRYDMTEALAAETPEAAPVYPDLLVPESLIEAEAAIIQDHPFEAKTFATTGPGIKAKPLMSPDNYATEVLKLIEGAEHSLYLQFSYIKLPMKEVFDDIVTAIGRKMQDGLDVRVLVGSSQNPEHSDFLIGNKGWKRSMFRRQSSKLHNKGILIDGKIAGVGSNNWSTDGTQYNRDTTLIFFSRPIAQYYTEVFTFDWDNLSKPISSQQEVVPILAPETGPTPLGMIRIPWQAWFDE